MTVALLENSQTKRRRAAAPEGGAKPPPDAPKAPATGASDQSDHHDQLVPEGNSELSIPRAPFMLSRHNRVLCCRRSFQSFPCPRCCRCLGPCDCEEWT